MSGEPEARFAWGDRIPQLTGDRIVLRPIEDSDLLSLFAIYSDEEVVKYWSSPAMTALAEAEELLVSIRSGFAKRELFEWGVALRETDELFGTCTLYNLDVRHRRGEIGFALRRTHWGRGFASEALSLALSFAFERLDLHRIEADADPENVQSLRLMERHGFKREGYLRERWHHLGEVRDAVFLGLLRSEWTTRSTQER